MKMQSNSNITNVENKCPSFSKNPMVLDLVGGILLQSNPVTVDVACYAIGQYANPFFMP